MDKKTQALKLALEALEEIALAGMSPAPEMIDSKEAFHARQAWRFIGIAARQLTAIREALADQPAQPKGCQCPACKIAPHASDCPVHNEPAWPNGPCDCGAQPEQEPVAWMHWLHGPVRLFLNRDEAQMELERLNREYPVDADGRKMRPLVFGDTSPPASKPWVGLTYGEVLEQKKDDPIQFYRAIEAKLKEKNA